MQVFSRALGVSEAELFKLMENGQLVSSEVLPKVAKELKKSALAGGAFEKALKSLQVTQGQLITGSQRMADTIFSNGFAEGLSELYKTLSEDMQSTGKSQKDLGNIYKNVFKFIAKAMRVITPLIEATVQVVSKLTDVLMLSAEGWKMLYNGLPDNLKSVAVGVTAIGLAFKSTIAKAAVLIAMFQEVASLFDDKLVGALEIKLGSQFNLGKMTQQAIRKDDKTGKYFAQGETKGLLDTDVGKGVALAGGLATLATTVYALQKAIGLFSTATTLAAKVMGVVGGTSSVIPTADGKDGKNKGKNKYSKFFSKLSKTEIAAVAVTATNYAAKVVRGTPWLAAVTQQSSADDSTFSSTADLYKKDLLGLDPSSSEFARKRDAITNMNNQLAAPNILQGLNLFQTRPDTPSVKIDGFEINVNLANGNLQQAQQAGSMLGDSFIEKLNSGLSAAIKGGR